MRLSTCALSALFVAGCLPSQAHAAEDDFNIWLGQFATINATKKFYVRLEAQERLTNDADRLGQLLLRSLAAYRINKKINLGAGYAFVLTDPVGPVELNEHRIYQEFNIRLIDQDGITLDSRSRLEQRTFEERGGVSVRFRNFVQLRVPVREHNKLVLYTEHFIELNETSVQAGGLSIWRNFIGVSAPLAKGVEIVPGYLNQYVFRPGEDRSDHVANVSVFLSF